MREITIAENLDELNILAAAKVIEIADDAIRHRGRFTIALAGGSTPKSLYRLLAGPEFKDKIDWPKVFFFFGDERTVRPTDPESNFRMARETLLDPLSISPDKVFRWPAEIGSANMAAVLYQKAILDFFGPLDWFPRLDLILLGIGTDGHTASLFPFSPALKEKSMLAVSNWVKQLDTHRLTMTFPLINNAANIVFLVTGDEKAPALREILEGEDQRSMYPAQGIDPKQGNLYWLLDRPAARLLTSVS